jgi:hypothetical protein
MATKKKAASKAKAAKAKGQSDKKINLLPESDVSVPTPGIIVRLADSYAKQATTADSVQLSGAIGLVGGALAASTGLIVGGTIATAAVTGIVALSLTEERAVNQDCSARTAGKWLRSWFVSDDAKKA